MSYADRDGVIWMDGQKLPWRDANVHVLTHSLHYGVGAFEGIRAYETERGTAIFRLEDHIRRLFDTAHILEMDITYTQQEIRAACVDNVRDNQPVSAYIRPLVFYGSEGMGLHAQNLSVHVAIASWFWGAYLGADALEKGIRIKTSSFTRHLVNSASCAAPRPAAITSIPSALQEAARDGYDEALLLDNEGMVAEGSGENIFVVRRGVLYTPEISLARRHHPRHHHAPGARRRHRSGREAHHARRDLHCRRMFLHRHCGRGHADPRTRQPHHRQRFVRPDDAPAAGNLPRCRHRPARSQPGWLTYVD